MYFILQKIIIAAETVLAVICYLIAYDMVIEAEKLADRNQNDF